jgi:zinc protease
MKDVEDRDALLVLDSVLSGVQWPAGRLHKELRGRGLVYLVHAHSFLGYGGPGYFGIYALTQPAKVKEVTRLIREHVKRVKDAPVPADELERARKMAVTVTLLGRQTNDALATNAALDELYGLGYDFSDDFAERVNAVTREDVQRVARKYLTRHAAVVVRPEPQPAPAKAE